MKKIKSLLLFLVCLLCFASVPNSSFAQKKAYYYKPWKGKESINTKKVIFVIDSLGSENSYEALERITNELSSQLSKSGINSSTIRLRNFQQSDRNENLIFILSLGSPAYVSLNGLEPKILLCNMISFKEDSFLPSNPKHRIDTTIAISIDKNEEAITPLSEDLAKRILILNPALEKYLLTTKPKAH
jgi:hypothetical protein